MVGEIISQNITIQKSITFNCQPRKNRTVITANLINRVPVALYWRISALVDRLHAKMMMPSRMVVGSCDGVPLAAAISSIIWCPG